MKLGHNRAATKFAHPSAMSLEELEKEIQALSEHQEDLKSKGETTCKRKRCDGRPHSGFPYPHDPKYPAESTPLDEAILFDPATRRRDHLELLSRKLTEAVEAVENGENRHLVVSMPPRSGKSFLTSVNLPMWLLHRHPEWKIGLISHNPTLATGWGRAIRRMVEESPEIHGIQLAKDAGAASEWETTQGGGITSRSAPGQSLTGLGFKVMLIDDPVKDFATAHSSTARQEMWDWWTAVAQTRLEQPYLVVMVGTRWHEDDLLARVLSPEYDGDPEDWEEIRLPAIAEEGDALGREPGQPLYSPLMDETEEEALKRWDKTKRNVGSYGWASLYQQRPAPAKGAIFDTEWWRFWTRDPNKATDDGTILYVNPEEDLAGAKWLDSWDTAFKDTKANDFVVAQRWARRGPNRFLIAQKRGRWNFTRTLSELDKWARSGDPINSPFGRFVHERLIEATANGPALIEVMQEHVSGIKAVDPRMSKEARARAITPEVESGHVYLPLPSDAGNSWVNELLGELRNFPFDAHDDQVDALTQGLGGLRDEGRGMLTVPGRVRERRQLPGRANRSLGMQTSPWRR